MSGLITYDFDGVIADSEFLSNTVLAEAITELGMSTTLEDAYRLYMGKRIADVIMAIEASLGRRLPKDFPIKLQERMFDRFRRDLRIVEGARDHIDNFRHVPKCIASSSSPDRLAMCMEVLDLHCTFGGKVFSASMVTRGKPHPDIFLHAAKQMNTEPSKCIVIEDSPSGVEAGAAAGMTVIGLLAATHIQVGQAERLRAAGAHHIASTFKEAKKATQNLLASLPPA